MIKDITYKEKFAILKDWIPQIIDCIKKDLKNEHLKKDYSFTKKFLGTANYQRLTNEELAKGYSEAMQEEGEGAEQLGEFIANRWLLKHTDIYHLFEDKLSKINPDFNELSELTKEQALELMEQSNKEFGAVNTYLFCLLNSVVFPQEVFDKLAQQAKQEHAHQAKEAAAKAEIKSFEDLKRDCELQISRLTDRYEKKLLGIQKKYHQDTEALKKQIAGLQRKLQGV